VKYLHWQSLWRKSSQKCQQIEPFLTQGCQCKNCTVYYMYCCQKTLAMCNNLKIQWIKAECPLTSRWVQLWKNTPFFKSFGFTESALEGFVLGNCDKFQFTYGISIWNWNWIYWIFKTDRIPICYLSNKSSPNTQKWIFSNLTEYKQKFAKGWKTKIEQFIIFPFNVFIMFLIFWFY
jgi:hypothetical protein